MNCPKCKKPLPKSNPRLCPNCRQDLTNYYKLLEKQGKPVQSKKPFPLLAVILAAVVVCGLIVGAILLFSGGGSETPAAEGPLEMEAVKAEIDSKQVSDFVETDQVTNYVKLTVVNFGELVVRLRPDVAPISVQNFQDLVRQGYYDGTLFHRVYPGFMIQGGAGAGTLTPIKGEFSSNGVDNPLLHVRGVLSMARTTEKDSATSQFFLMHADYPSLNGNYAAFGYIVAGLDTVDRVCEIELGVNSYNGERSVPQVEVRIESAVFVTPKDPG